MKKELISVNKFVDIIRPLTRTTRDLDSALLKCLIPCERILSYLC